MENDLFEKGGVYQAFRLNFGLSLFKEEDGAQHKKYTHTGEYIKKDDVFVVLSAPMKTEYEVEVAYKVLCLDKNKSGKVAVLIFAHQNDADIIGGYRWWKKLG